MFCSNCGKETPDTAGFCGSCGGQISSGTVSPVQTSSGGEAELATVARRLGALALDALIEVFTLYVGWIVWFLVVCGRGQTPGKQLVGIYAAKVSDTQRPLSWGSMFLREFVIKGLLFAGVISIFTSGIVGVLDYLWALWDGTGHRQTLHDKVSQTSVYQKMDHLNDQ